MQRHLPFAARWLHRTALLVAALALSAAALAQPRPLEGLLPATTVAAFYLAPTAGDLGVLEEVWAEVGGEAAGETFMRVLALLDADLAELDAAEFDVMALLLDELAWVCPEIVERYDEARLPGLAGPSVLAISISPFNPFPGGIALARPADVGYAAELQDALIQCFGEGPSFTQDDVTLHVLGDGSDLPLVVARFDDTFVAATDPDLVRAAVRLARGSDEPSHLDGKTGANASLIMDGGIGVSVDFGALADGVRGLTGAFLVDPEAEAAVDRLLVSLASLGGGAARLTVDADGLRFDGFLAPDPSAGDAALAALLACPDCTVGTDAPLPAGVVSVGGGHLDVRGAVAWLDGLLADLGASIGETLDVRSLAAAVGLDLDVLVLDWIGAAYHSAQLEPLATDLASWLVGPFTVTSIDVLDESATRAALHQWRALLEGDPTIAMLLEELLYELAFMVDPFGPGPTGLPLGEGGVLAVRDEVYRGVGYERWRIGPTLDVGFLVHDGRLVIGMPAAALRAVIDVEHGAEAIATDPRLGSTLRGLDGRVNAYSVSDTPRHLEGLATLSDLLAAPLATFVGIAVEEAFRDPWGGWDDWDDWGWDDGGGLSGLWRSSGRYGSSLLSDVPSVNTLSVPDRVTAVISDSDTLPNGDYGLVFELVDLVPGTTVMVEMLDPNRSWDMDTYLYLYDVDAGIIIADNDDAPDTNRSELLFVVEPGVRYAVVASSWGGNDVGDVVLESSVTDWGDEEGYDEPWDDQDAWGDTLGMSDHVDVPSFAELVRAFDTVTDALRALSERVGVAVGSTVVEDGVRRSSWSLPLR